MDEHRHKVSLPPQSAVIRVGIVEDQREIREGLAMLIGGTAGFEVIDSFRSMEDALDAIARDLPDVMLMDIGLPGMSGIEGIRILGERHPSLRMLVLSVYDDDDRIFEALCAGACGYLLKETPPARLLESLREVMAGGSPISPEIARKVISIFRDFRPRARKDHDLTPHEMRILKLLVDGYTYKTAAAELDVSVNTVAFHIKHIYEKLQVHSKTAAVSRALRNGFFD